jgi:hydroxyacylglutathione hydrolase
MIFQQLVNEESGCLSYLIGCAQAGEAVIVDPGRDRVAEYLRVARKKGLRITHVVETHTHADHISGNRDLAAATNAAIHLHPAAGATFDHDAVRDGDAIRIGNIELKVAHTPGHTPDSICLLVTDHARGAEPWFALTGDTLFVGSVGRPDLGGERAAEELYESLGRVLLTLDDSVEVYPAHGAGSSCGRAMSAKSGSTIGFERRFNPALRLASKPAFVHFIMDGIPPKPVAFETIVGKNRGIIPLQTAKPRPYTAREAREAMERGACVLDVRDPAAYGEAHVPGAINVWVESPQFAERAAAFVVPGAPILLMGPGPADLERAVQALARVGVDDVIGFLQWGMIDWRSDGLPVETVPQISVHDLEAWLDQGADDLVVIDVRETFEWMEGHIAGALHLPMLEATRRRDEVPLQGRKAVLCAGGLRSSTVISALQRLGIANWYNVTGGMTAWGRAGYPIERPGPAGHVGVPDPAPRAPQGPEASRDTGGAARSPVPGQATGSTVRVAADVSGGSVAPVACAAPAPPVVVAESAKAERVASDPGADGKTGPRPITAAAPPPAMTLDCCGLTCPMPNLKLAKAIPHVPVGAVIEMLATDPGADADLDAFVRGSGHRVVARSERDGVFRFLIERMR